MSTNQLHYVRFCAGALTFAAIYGVPLGNIVLIAVILLSLLILHYLVGSAREFVKDNENTGKGETRTGNRASRRHPNGKAPVRKFGRANVTIKPKHGPRKGRF